MKVWGGGTATIIHYSTKFNFWKVEGQDRDLVFSVKPIALGCTAGVGCL